MPVTKKSHDFIEGYIQGKLEPKLIEALVNKQNLDHSVIVPKSWFGLRAVKSESVCLVEHEESKLRLDIKDVLKQYNTNKTEYKYDVVIYPDEQYIRFVIHGERHEVVKEMTIAEIEKELGYKIKVIGE